MGQTISSLFGYTSGPLEASPSAPKFIAPPPELDIEYIFDFHLANNPDYPVFQHPDDDDDTQAQVGAQRVYRYSEVVPAIHRAGWIVSESIGHDVHAAASGRSSTPVVAVFAEINNLTYATVVLGLLRAGITAFLISPRYHSTVIAELLKMAKPSHVLVNDTLRQIAVDAVASLALAAEKSTLSPKEKVPVVVDLPAHSALYPGHDMFDRLPRHCEDFGKQALIVHSSSSTSSCPKTIPWSSNYMRANSIAIEYSDLNFEGKIFGGQSAEFFHTAGLYILFGMPRVGFTMALMSPYDPKAIIPANRDMVLDGFKKSRVELGWASPRFLEAWAREGEKIEYLAGLEGIIYGGSALSKAAGDKLVANGVKLCNAYGATECGAISKFVSEPQTTDWEYFNLNPGIKYKLLPREDNLYEVVILYQNGYHEIPVCNTKWQGHAAYETGDLLVSHPFKPDFYKVIGRNKDMILLSSGQAVNPVFIEDALRTHPEIKDAVVFGHGRPFLGILVAPGPSSAAFNGDASACDDTAEMGNIIWDVVDRYNATLPEFSKIRKESFLLADEERPFLYGEKGLSKRSLILDEYRNDIEKCFMSML